MNALPVHDDRYLKTKMKTYGDAQNKGVECKYFAIISIDSLLAYNKKL